MALGLLASDNNDGHRLTPAHGDRDVLDADGDRIASDNALMQHLDPGAFDKAEFDQPAFKFDRRQRGAGAAGRDVVDHAGIAALNQA